MSLKNGHEREKMEDKMDYELKKLTELLGKIMSLNEDKEVQNLAYKSLTYKDKTVDELKEEIANYMSKLESQLSLKYNKYHNETVKVIGDIEISIYKAYDFIDSLFLMKRGYIMKMQHGRGCIFQMLDDLLYEKMPHEPDSDWRISENTFYVLNGYNYNIFTLEEMGTKERK